MYSGYETVSTTSMMGVKYLHDHPKVLEELRVSAKILTLSEVYISMLLSGYCCSNCVQLKFFTEGAFGHKRKEKSR